MEGVVLNGFTKKYGTFIAANNISFIANPGQVTGLLGANGAGKTTVLKAICTIHLPTDGHIRVNGIDVVENPIEVKANIGYVSEQPSLYPELTVREFLKFTTCTYLNAMNNYAKKLCNQLIEDTAEKCAITDVLSQRIITLSKGYRQRVSFAQAVIHNPSVLILDEPTSGLDPLQIIQMRQLIKKEALTKTVIISTHIMQEAESLCDKVNILSCGHLVESGTKEEVIARTGASNLEDAFLTLNCVTEPNND